MCIIDLDQTRWSSVAVITTHVFALLALGFFNWGKFRVIHTHFLQSICAVYGSSVIYLQNEAVMAIHGRFLYLCRVEATDSVTYLLDYMAYLGGS